MSISLELNFDFFASAIGQQIALIQMTIKTAFTTNLQYEFSASKYLHIYTSLLLKVYSLFSCKLFGKSCWCFLFSMDIETVRCIFGFFIHSSTGFSSFVVDGFWLLVQISSTNLFTSIPVNVSCNTRFCIIVNSVWLLPLLLMILMP